MALIATPSLAQDSAATLSVTGEGSVNVAPDMATISLGVTVNGDTAKAALDANSAALSAVVEKLKAAGIDAKDIQTTGLSINPMFDFSASGNPQRVLGYNASNMVTVRVRAIDTVGAILDASVTDGANTLNGISFGLTDPVPATDEARVAAVADARRRAELLATAAGVALGPIVSISESQGFAPSPMMAGAAFDRAAAVPIAAGEMSVAASVNVTFRIDQ